MSKIIENRKSEYTRLSKSKNHPRVFAGKLKGIVISRGEGYYGEAGRSSRLWVLWPSGRKTLCCVKGMKQEGNDYRIET